MRLLLFEPAVERFDGGHFDSVRIDRVVRAIRIAEAEGRIEVLGHRSQVTHRWSVALVRPRGDGHARDPLEYRLFVDGLDIAFEVSVAHAKRSTSLCARRLIGRWRKAHGVGCPDGARLLAAKLPVSAARRAAARFGGAACGATFRTGNRLAGAVAIVSIRTLDVATVTVERVVGRVDALAVAAGSPNPARRSARADGRTTGSGVHFSASASARTAARAASRRIAAGRPRTARATRPRFAPAQTSTRRGGPARGPRGRIRSRRNLEGRTAAISVQERQTRCHSHPPSDRSHEVCRRKNPAARKCTRTLARR